MMKHFCLGGHMRENLGLFGFVLDKMDFKFTWRDQCPRIAKNIMRKKNGRWWEECVFLEFKTLKSYSNQNSD